MLRKERLTLLVLLPGISLALLSLSSACKPGGRNSNPAATNNGASSEFDHLFADPEDSRSALSEYLKENASKLNSPSPLMLRFQNDGTSASCEAFYLDNANNTSDIYLYPDCSFNPTTSKSAQLSFSKKSTSQIISVSISKSENSWEVKKEEDAKNSTSTKVAALIEKEITKQVLENKSICLFYIQLGTKNILARGKSCSDGESASWKELADRTKDGHFWENLTYASDDFSRYAEEALGLKDVNEENPRYVKVNGGETLSEEKARTTLEGLYNNLLERAVVGDLGLVPTLHVDSSGNATCISYEELQIKEVSSADKPAVKFKSVGVNPPENGHQLISGSNPRWIYGSSALNSSTSKHFTLQYMVALFFNPLKTEDTISFAPVNRDLTGADSKTASLSCGLEQGCTFATTTNPCD